MFFIKYMKINLLFFIGLSGFLAVALGAFGAHGLKPYLDDYQRNIFEKAVHYQFFHTLAAAFAFIFFEYRQQKSFYYAVVFFLIGILFFSGSLYLLAIRSLLSINVSIVGPITPIGGICFLIGWGLIIKSSINYTRNNG